MSSDEAGPAAASPNPKLNFKSNEPRVLHFTGERYTPEIGGAIRREHHHRYLAAAGFCAGREVLDVASGEGYGAHLLGQSARRVTGLDIDIATVEAAARRYGAPNVEFVAGDAVALPFADSSFDVITSFETLEHIERWEAFLAELRRVLRPDGQLLISTPNRDVYSDGYQNPFHLKEFDREEFRLALRRFFSHVELFEQREVTASLLLPEHRPPAGAAGAFFETADGASYELSASLPGPRYFLAIAGDRPPEASAGTTLIDASPAEPPAETNPDADAAFRAAELQRRLARSERQAALLRRSLQQWGETPLPIPILPVATAPRATPRTPFELGKTLLRRLRSRLRRYRSRGRARREFDLAHYLKTYPDVAAAGVDPFRHYMDTGWREGRDPGPGFATDYYLDSNPDVVALDMNPLLHFVLYGRGEGRSPRPGIKASPTLDFGTANLPAPPLEAGPPTVRRAELIAFYLPQFHTIPENDQWWGKGFTEWTNVRSSSAQFTGHNQPRVPGELGYYDLGDPEVQRRQIALARQYGIGGFCFYFYWFAGKRLLEKPLEAWLADKSLDFPFCICWANENWTRRWDGKDTEVLIAQDHSAEDDIAFIEAAAPYLRDERYIRVDGKPVLVVYRPSLLPAAKKTVRRWRDWCRDNGIGEIHLAYTQSFERVDPASFDFDAAIEFPPNNIPSENLTDFVQAAPGMERLRVHDWGSVAAASEHYDKPPYLLYRGVCPGWDNSPRRRNGGVVFVNNTPERYRAWLDNAIADTAARIAVPADRLVFINAWNEWAEGAYLEPDRRHGYAYLRATREAVEQTPRPASRSILIVTHDAHPHGAQYLALHLARAYAELGFIVHVLALGDGPLLDRFSEVALVHRLHQGQGERRIIEALQRLRETGAEVAIANTTVSGWLVPLLKHAGFATLSLIHEMPAVLKQMRLDQHAAAIAAAADHTVFAAQLVRDGFEQFVGHGLSRATILPQGLIRPNPFKSDPARAHRLVTERHGLAPDARIVLAIGYAEARKGPDLLLEAATEVLARCPDIVFLWIGHFGPGEEAKLKAEVKRRGLAGRFQFLGFVAEPLDYYAAATVYALPSREDPFPNVVLEAAAVGVPVVAFAGRTGAAEFIAAHGGRLVPAFDTTAFAAAVEALAALPRRPARTPVPSIRQYAADLLALATSRPRVSVLVPNYNYARYLKARLEGIVGQSWAPYEIVALDDASTDGSAELLADFADAHPESDIHVVLGDRNSGSVFRQWVKGLSLCRGDLVWIAEADDVAEPGFLDAMVEQFRNPEVVLAYCQSRQIDTQGKVIAGDYLDYTGDISDRWSTDHGRDGKLEIAEAMAVKNTIPNVSAVLFRKAALQAALDELGERLFDYRVAGDWLVYLHVLLRGRIAFVAEPLNRHRRHQHSVTSATDAELHLEEVVRMQELARSLVPISEQTASQATAWRRHVQKHLGLKPDRVRS